MIPEREREALMRLTMCAREECDMCKYTYNCNFDFQRELATKNMNILADALRTADRKTEPTISKMEQVDKPYIDIETGILHWCGWKYKRIYEDEPQTDCAWR